MEKTLKAHPAVSLFLVLRIVFTTMPISAAEVTPEIGNIVSIGTVIVDGSPRDSGKLLDGDRIRTGDLSSAKVVLLDGNGFQLSSGTDLVVTRNNENVRLQLSSGTVSFAAADNHLAMAFGQYQISPQSGASGSVTIKDGSFAAVRLETGRATLHNADERTDILLSDVSERTLALKRISSSPNNKEGPQILSVDPSSLKQGSERTSVTIKGRSTNFFLINSVEVSGPGVTVESVEVIDSTQLRAIVSLTSEATPGPRTLTVATGDGTATSTMNINPAATGAGGGNGGGSQGGSHTGVIIGSVAGAGGVAAAVLALKGNKPQPQTDPAPVPVVDSRAPVAAVDSFTTNEDTTLTAPAPGVLANDTDADGDALTAKLNGSVSHGTLALAANGSFTYAPAANFNGTDSFTYRANDGKSDGNVMTVSITVTAVNDAPVSMNNSYTATRNTALNVPAGGVLTNDTDVDGGTLTAALNSSVQHGTLNLNADGSFAYTPASNYTGPDSFTYHATDGTLNANVATVSITVTAVNIAPVSNNDSYTATKNATLNVPAAGLLTNDTDANGDTLSAALITSVQHGTLTLSANGSFVYTPALNYSGPDSFTYRANDGTLNSNVATVSIAVTAPNTPPVLTAGGTLTYTESAPAAPIDNTITVSDVDGGNLASATAQITANCVNPQDVLSFTNQNGITGVYTAANCLMTLTGSASLANYQTALRSIRYNNTSSSPSTAARSVTWIGNDGTAPSTAVTSTINALAVNGAPVLTAGRTLSYTENANAAVIDNTITVIDVDGANLTSATAQITANCVNPQDVLSFTNQNGITGVYTAASCLMTLTGSGSLANYQAALRSVRYNNTSANPNTAARTVTWIGNDGTASAAVTSTINISAVNSAPVLTAGATLNYIRNAAATVIDNTITVSDVDSANLASATVQITDKCDNPQDVLSFTNQNGITGAYSAGNCRMSLTGSASLANYQAALRSIKYNNTATNPNTQAMTVTWIGNDGTAASTAVTSTITISSGGAQLMSLDVTKDVNVPVVAPGDTVVFSLGIVNTSTTTALTTASLNDTLPAGFAYSADSAIIRYLGLLGETTLSQAITPSVTSDGLVFPIDTLGAGDRASIIYSAVVKSDAHPGEAKSSVVGIVNLLSGKQSKSNPAHVSVTVTAGAFTLNQVLLGRVFEDRNRNGKFDGGEPGVANVRVVTSSGQTSTTDSDGQYSLPSLAPGSVLVAVDPATLPPGFERLGAGQILQTPLGGGGLLRQNFGLITVGAVYDRPNFKSMEIAGGHRPPLQSPGPRLEMDVKRSIMKAGAYDKQLIRIRAFDKAGQSLDTSIVVKTEKGAVMVAAQISDQYACESVLSLEQRPDRSRQVSLETNSGEAAVCLISDVVPGITRLTASATRATSDETLSASAIVRFEAEQRSPLLVAIGEVGIGLSGPGRNATDGARRVDGQASIFYQSSLYRNDLFTVAVRSKGSVNSATGADGLFEFDPTQRIFPVMGDASTRQELAQSSGPVYVRYDRGDSYIMYGDLHGDTAAEGRSGLLEYNRNVTGLRFQLQGPNPTNWIQGQVASPKTAFKREITTALVGSAFRLSESQIVRGSETITLEVRDRRNPERIISRENLVRNVDYWLDPQSGVLFMMRPFAIFDSSLNIVQLVSTYEFQAIGIQSATYLGRGSYAFTGVGLRLGASALSQSEGGDKLSAFSVGGLELEQKLFNGGHFKAELPVSHGRLRMDPNSASSLQRGKAIRAEFEQPLGIRSTVLRGRFAKTDPGFFNPYGAIAVAGQASRGIFMETRGIQSGKVRLGFEQEVNQNQAVDNRRQTLSVGMTQTLTESLSAEAGFDHRNFEDRRSAQHIDSNLISAGLKWKPFSRLDTYVRREQNLGKADPTYPSQTLLGAQFKLNSTHRIFATQRISSSPITPIGGAETSGVLVPQSTKETAIGVESRLRQNTSLTTNYTMDSSLSGTDSFAVLGVLTRVPIRSGLSIDWSLDTAMHLAGEGKGFVGGSLGFTETLDDKLRISVRYELRRRDTTETSLTAGVVGRLNASTSALARYRTAEYPVNGIGQPIGRISDGQLALSVRPKKSDSVAMLFSYDFGNASPASVRLARTDRLSMDGLIEMGRGFEFYSRVSAARTPGIYGGSRVGTYLQGRLQKSLTKRFDIAGEARWVQESKLVRGALIVGLEWGTWLSRDLRVGLGYSPSGFANPGALLNSTAARGGVYLVISSRLSGIFDLMGGSEKSNSATSVTAESK